MLANIPKNIWRYLLCLCFTIACCTFSFGNSKADSLLNNIQSASDNQKLDLWKSWFKKANKETVLLLNDKAYLAFQDAERIIGRDSAVLWYFSRQINLASSLRKYNFTDRTPPIFEKMKITADSLSAIEGKPHRTLLKFYYHLGYFHYIQVEMDRAREVLAKGIEVSKEAKNVYWEYRCYKLLGLLESYEENTEKALEYSIKMEEIIDDPSINNISRLSFFQFKAYLHLQLEQYQKSNEYYQILLDSSHLFTATNILNIKFYFGSNLCDLGLNKKCLDHFRAIEKDVEKYASEEEKITFGEKYSEALLLNGFLKEGTEWVGITRGRFADIVEARQSEKALEWQAKFKQAETEAENETLRLEKKATQNRLIIISLTALLGIIGLLFYGYRNRNKRKQLAMKLETDKAIAENRDRLFSSITHDIRTPLALMLAPLERAENTVKNIKTKADIQMARRNGKRLLELFNQILDWNKAEAKALQLNPQVGQIDLSLTSMIQRFQQEAMEKEVNFSSVTNLPVGQFSLDYDKLDKILSNLIGNAIKFVDDGQRVKLKVDYDKAGDNVFNLHLEVSDEGPGIGEEEQKKLFNRYVQGKQGKLKGGTGIGLALVKELVQMMKGDLQLKSKLGEGTTFTINLPMQKVMDTISSVPVLEELGPSQRKPNSEKPFVLVVEDEPDLLEFLRSVLVNDFEVEIANTTNTGLNLAISQIPDIIISDWTLPDNTGGWLCEQLQQNELTQHIPVIVLTAHNSESHQRAAFDAGAVAWMNKPFKVDTLQRQLKTILDQQARVQNMWAKKSLPENVSDKQSEQVETIDPFMQKVLDSIEENYKKENFSVEKMAESLFLSRVQLFRKVKNITGSSPSKLLNEIRLKKARHLLQTTAKSVSEVTFDVGFSDPSYFSKAYKQYFDISPSQESK